MRALRLQRDTALDLCFPHVLDASEMPIDERRIGKRTEVFGAL
jgi:hypothetical protein